MSEWMREWMSEYVWSMEEKILLQEHPKYSEQKPFAMLHFSDTNPTRNGLS